MNYALGKEVSQISLHFIRYFRNITCFVMRVEKTILVAGKMTNALFRNDHHKYFSYLFN